MSRPYFMIGADRGGMAQQALMTVAAIYRSLLNGVMCWCRRRRDVRHLSELDDYLLKDIGLSRTNITAGVYGRRRDA